MNMLSHMSKLTRQDVSAMDLWFNPKSRQGPVTTGSYNTFWWTVAFTDFDQLKAMALQYYKDYGFDPPRNSTTYPAFVKLFGEIKP